MRLALPLAAALVAACATPRAVREGARPDLVSLSRATVIIDQLDQRRGDELLAERQQRSDTADRYRYDPRAQFLAIWAQPRGEDRWAAFRQLARTFPRSALGQVGMASVYVEWRTLDQVDRAVALALAVEPDNWLAVLYRGEAAELRERWEAAKADYAAVLAADPGNADAHLGLARMARRRGDAAAARGEAEAVLAAAPDHLGALGLLADLAHDAGDLAGAAAVEARIGESSPRDRDPRLRLARTYRALGKPDLARDQLRAAARLRDDAEVLGLLADAARAAGDGPAEAEALERLSALDPSSADWRRVGEMRLAAGDLEGAERALRRALARAPRDPAVNAALGRTHLRRGEPREAVEALRLAGDAGRAELAALERRLHLERLTASEPGRLEAAVQALLDLTSRERAAGAPTPAGALELRVTVNPAGQATGVELVADTVHDADLRACAYWNLRDASYPQNEPGRLTFSFSFSTR